MSGCCQCNTIIKSERWEGVRVGEGPKKMRADNMADNMWQCLAGSYLGTISSAHRSPKTIQKRQVCS